jgi:hypothetical protein
MNQIDNSPGAAIIGDNASHVHQTTNVSIQGIQDIAQLSALVEQSNAPNKALMQECLDIVRNHLAGSSSKAQAKTAWETFTANVGALAKAGNESGASSRAWPRLLDSLSGRLFLLTTRGKTDKDAGHDDRRSQRHHYRLHYYRELT